MLLRLLLVFAVVELVAVFAEDYYDLLGVSKDADNREIRKAFKKLALLHHPDKNQGDDSAEAKFVRINRAYETLKDEESRRKYDLHGDEESHNQGFNRNYQSWTYYNENFGIYDDDPEIVTLSRHDFEHKVLDSSEIWFINFYSPMCSHCHHIAPQWREMARELLGQVNVGAVNCEEDWHLCRQRGIHSYPSIMVYPQNEKYHGERITSHLVNFILSKVPNDLLHLDDAKLQHLLEDRSRNNLPWLIFICDITSDCPTRRTQLKVATMLDKVVNVGTLDVDQLGFVQFLTDIFGTILYKPGQVARGQGTIISSMDALEIIDEVLLQLPIIAFLNADSLQDLIEEDVDATQIIIFVEDGGFVDATQELKRLPYLFPDIKVNQVDCTENLRFCQDVHVSKFPSLVVVKPGGKIEFHHGKLTAKEISVFVKESINCVVESLSPADFKTRVAVGSDLWVVDFYAPWCPPCLRFLPEFRKASRQMGNLVHFGTVDCVSQHELCKQHGIRNYPTTIFYNQSTVHHYNGQFEADELVDFIKDTMAPSVMQLNFESFSSLVMMKAEDEVWAVDFFAPWCGPCQQLAPQWKKMAQMVSGIPEVQVGQVDCTIHSDLCDRQNVHSYPTMRLYPRGSFHQSSVVSYNGWSREAHALKTWVLQYLPSNVVELDNNAFYNDVIYNVQPWLVEFYVPWCQHCQNFVPVYEELARTLKGKVRVGKVNCDTTQYVCSQARIGEYPTIAFYNGSSDSDTAQEVLGKRINSQDRSTIMSYVERLMKQDNRLRNHDEL